MQPIVSIRPARPDENALLSALALRSKAHWGYSAEFMAACREELSLSSEDIASPHFSYFVAETQGELVGYYALERLSAVEYELEALFVEPEHIGKGYGRLLFEHATALVRRLGAASLLIQGDPHATKFYRAVGAVQIGVRESASIPGRYLPEFRICFEK